MDLGIAGNVAVVTGGSKGIGNAIARTLADEGTDLAICARSAGPLEEAGDEIEANYGVECLPVREDHLEPGQPLPPTGHDR